MTNHTPGPWKIVKTTHKSEFVNVLTAGEAMEHLFYMEVAPGQKKAEANARLIAAAPDLLEALKLAIAALNTATRFKVPSENTDSYKIVAICDKALANATGK